jgi:hypothetical protein
MSNEETEPWRHWGIDKDSWEQGWRRTLRDAVEAEFAGDRAGIDEPKSVQIFVRKRSDNAVHDYRVGS